MNDIGSVLGHILGDTYPLFRRQNEAILMLRSLEYLLRAYHTVPRLRGDIRENIYKIEAMHEINFKKSLIIKVMLKLKYFEMQKCFSYISNLKRMTLRVILCCRYESMINCCLYISRFRFLLALIGLTVYIT